jgi:hypothetical protein
LFSCQQRRKKVLYPSNLIGHLVWRHDALEGIVPKDIAATIAKRQKRGSLGGKAAITNGTISNDVSTNNMSTNDVSTNISANDVSANDVSANDISTNDVSANDISTKDISANNVSANNISANNVSANNVSANNVSANNVNANNVSANNVSANDVSANGDCNVILTSDDLETSGGSGIKLFCRPGPIKLDCWSVKSPSGLA